MNQKKKLGKILEYLMNNQTEKASELTKTYILECAAAAHQQLMESEEDVMDMERTDEPMHGDMGDELADEISADKDEIESEEMFDNDDNGEFEFHSDELEFDDEPEVGNDEFSVSDLEDTVDDLETTVDDLVSDKDDLEAAFEELAAEFEKIKNGETDEQSDDTEEEKQDADLDLDVDQDLEDDSTDDLEESVDFDLAKVDGKDHSPDSKEKSPIAKANDRLNRLGGEPVKVVDKGHKGFDRQDVKVPSLTKHSNLVSTKASQALSKVETKKTDSAPHAGENPAMPKGKK